MTKIRQAVFLASCLFGSALAQSPPVQVRATGGGSFPGTIVCQDLDTVGKMLDAYSQRPDARKKLEANGCTLVQSGTPMTAEYVRTRPGTAPFPEVSGTLPDGTRFSGVTLPEMVKGQP